MFRKQIRKTSTLPELDKTFGFTLVQVGLEIHHSLREERGTAKERPINESALASGINLGGYLLLYNIFFLKAQIHCRGPFCRNTLKKQSLQELSTSSRNLSIVISFSLRGIQFLLLAKNI